MYLNKTLFIFLLLFCWQGITAEKPNACSPRDDRDNLEVKVNDHVSYFFKIHPDGEYLAFIGGESNQLLNMGTGEQKAIPGHVDPVFTPDGEYLTIPMTHEKNYNGDITYETTMGFFDFKKIKDEGSSAKPDFSDDENNGVYQSIGQVSKNEYRLITDKNGATINDHTHQKLKRTRSEAISPCSNDENFATDLPMLSKDGRFISSLDTNTDTTKIYRLNQDGSCELALDLGFATGKISFNHDSSQITFHVDYIGDPYNGGYFETVDEGYAKDVFVMNIDEVDGKLVPRDMAKVTNTGSLNQGAYYPEFDRKGNIYYVRDSNDYFSFHRASQDQLEFFPFDPYLSLLTSIENSSDANSVDLSCYEKNQAFFNQVLLGNLWSEICLKTEARGTDYFFFSKGVNSKNCEALVEANWNKTMIKKLISQSSTFSENVYQSVSVEDLKSVCPKIDEREEVEKVRIGEWEEKAPPKSHRDVISSRCVMCHQNELSYEKEYLDVVFVDENGSVVGEKKVKESRTMPSLAEENLDNLTVEEYARLVIAVADPNPATRMPRGGTLSGEEVQALNQRMFQFVSEGVETEQLNQAMRAAMRQPKTLLMTSEEFLNKAIKDLNSEYDAYDFGETPLEKIRDLRNHQINQLRCSYRRENCSEYIQTQAMINLGNQVAAQNLSQPEGTSALEFLTPLYQQNVMALRCELYFEVTRDQCP